MCGGIACARKPRLDSGGLRWRTWVVRAFPDWAGKAPGRVPWWGRAKVALAPVSAAARGGTPKCKLSRADRIRTCDLFVPNEARYQTALQLDVIVMTGQFYSKIQDLQVQSDSFFVMMPDFCGISPRFSEKNGRFAVGQSGRAKLNAMPGGVSPPAPCAWHVWW